MLHETTDRRQEINARRLVLFLVIAIGIATVAVVAVCAHPSVQASRYRIRIPWLFEPTPLAEFYSTDSHTDTSLDSVRTTHGLATDASLVPYGKLSVRPSSFARALRPSASDMEHAMQYQRTRKHRAAFVYLIRSNSMYVNELCQSLYYLYLNVNHRYGYPIFVYHEPDFTLEMQAQVRDCNPFERVPEGFGTPSLSEFSPDDSLPGRVQFIMIDMDNDITPEAIKPIRQQIKHLGYKNMIRWYSYLIFKHPSMADVDFYWRMDSDSMLPEPILYDPFQFMYDHKIAYAYRVLDVDEAHLTQGLPAAVREFMESRSLQFRNSLPTDRHDFQECDKRSNFAPFILPSGDTDAMPAIYNNIELVNVSVLGGQQFQDYFAYLDALGGIYHNQWGDAMFRYITVQLFLGAHQVWRFNDWDYVHSRCHGRTAVTRSAHADENDVAHLGPFERLVHSCMVARYHLLRSAHHIFWYYCVIVPALLSVLCVAYLYTQPALRKRIRRALGACPDQLQAIARPCRRLVANITGKKF